MLPARRSRSASRTRDIYNCTLTLYDRPSDRLPSGRSETRTCDEDNPLATRRAPWELIYPSSEHFFCRNGSFKPLAMRGDRILEYVWIYRDCKSDRPLFLPFDLPKRNFNGISG